jgi:chromosome segregation ATPase
MQADLFTIRGVPPRMLQVLDELHADSPDRWIPRRLVLANWWLFNEPQEIVFGRGNLMLTGKNASGKTTVLIAIITLVLDRIFHPSRIDTTGSNAKFVRYYLVGEDRATPEHNFYHEERTGYVALEFQRGTSDEFVTIGFALRTSRKWADRRIVPWSFVLTDGRRAGIDFHFVDPATKRPFSLPELKKELGDAQVFDDKEQRRYQQAVNDALYGFADVEDLLKYLDMLHIVRTPKLGDGLTPARVAELLVESLPPVDSAPIETAHDSFQRLDSIEVALRQIEEQRDHVDRLEKAQLESVLAAARRDAAAYRKALEELRRAERRLGDARAALETQRASWKDEEERERSLRAEHADLSGELKPLEETYRKHEAFDLARGLADARKLEEREASELENLQADHAAAEARREEAVRRLKRAEDRWRQRVHDLAQRVAEIGALAQTAAWPELAARTSATTTALRTASLSADVPLVDELTISTLDAEIEARTSAIAPVIEAHEQAEAAVAEHRRLLEEVARIRAEHTEADQRLGVLQRALEDAREEAADALRAWTESAAELPLSDAALQELLSGVQTWDTGSTVEALTAPLHPLLTRVREERTAERDQIVRHLGLLQTRRARAEERIQRLEQDDDVEPERSAATARARAALLEAGIPCAPLYATCAFRPGALAPAEEAAAEAALEAAGLLDALVVPLTHQAEVERELGEQGLADRWIRPAPASRKNPWLEAADGVAQLDQDSIEAALAAIAVQDGTQDGEAESATWITRAGRWQTGALAGTSASTGEVRYIGESNRRLQRERELAAARQALAELGAEIEHATETLRHLDRRLAALQSQWDALRSHSVFVRLGERVLEKDSAARDRDRKREALGEATRVEQAARERLNRARHAIDLAAANAPYTRGRSLEAVHEIAAALGQIAREAAGTNRTLQDLDEGREEYRSSRAARDRDARAAEEFGPRLNLKTERLRELRAEIKQLEALHAEKSVGLEELDRRVHELRARIEELDRLSRASFGAARKAEGEVQVLEPRVAEYEDHARSRRITAESAELTFSARLRSYPSLEGLALDAAEFGPETIAGQLLEESDAERAADLAESALASLREVYYQVRERFGEMSPRLDNETGIVIFPHPEGAMRAAELLGHLEEEVAAKQTARDEDDREIIEKVFLRDITEAVRKAIAGTREWIAQVNAVIQSMELPQGKVLRLDWEVRDRKTTDAYDPAHLNELLTRRGITLHQEKLEELIDIFRGMVTDARRQAAERGETVDYRGVLQEMLDYRKWYRLVIKRADETGRYIEVTRARNIQDNMAQRTLNLLLPLVCAVHARLSTASPAAPRLIGFDEAFAGVDDQNAAEIFGVLNKIGLDWVMATEKATLYGSHVTGCVTYEFLSDGKEVVPTAIIWDGTRQHGFEEDLMELESVFVLETTEIA